MTNRLSIFFILFCISANVTTTCSWQKLKNIPEIIESQQEAKKHLNNFLPYTLDKKKRHPHKYMLLQNLDAQVETIISLRPSDPNFKDKVLELSLKNNNALLLCETEYKEQPNLYDPNNSNVDGNDFNIMHTYQAYKECVKKILAHNKRVQESSLSN